MTRKNWEHLRIINKQIENPEFSFIFTINLDGKINIHDKIIENINSNKGRVGRKPQRKRENDQITREEFYNEKKTLFENLLDLESDRRPHYKYKPLEPTPLSHFIARTFLNKAVLACWETELDKKILKYILRKTKKRVTRPTRDTNKDISELQRRIRLVRAFLKPDLITIEIKLFSTGVVSLLIRSKLKDPGDARPIKLLPEEIIALLEYPNLAVDRSIPSLNKDGQIETGKEKSLSGFLNIFAYELANFVFNDFFRCLSDENKKEKTQFLKILRVFEKKGTDRYQITTRYKKGKYTNKIIKVCVTRVPNLKFLSEKVSCEWVKGEQYIVYRGDPEEQDKYLLLQQYKDSDKDHSNISRMFSVISESQPEENLPLYWNAPIHVYPYVGIRLNLVPGCYVDRTTGFLKPVAINVFTAMATQTPEFLRYLNTGLDISSYLKKNSVTKGQQDTIIIERRGFVAAGNRRIGIREEDLSLTNPYNTLLFCFESTFATSKSVGSFNRELEEFVSWKVQEHLNVSTKTWVYILAIQQKRRLVLYSVLLLLVLVFLELNLSCEFLGIECSLFFLIHVCVLSVFAAIFLSAVKHILVTHPISDLLNKARTLSPCEDFSSNITPSLTSEIALKGTTKVKEFTLNVLIDTVHRRLENYGHFLKTSNESLIVKVNWLISMTVLYVGIIKLVGPENAVSPLWISKINDFPKFFWSKLDVILTWGVNSFERHIGVTAQMLVVELVLFPLLWVLVISIKTKQTCRESLIKEFRAPISNWFHFRMKLVGMKLKLFWYSIKKRGAR